MNEKKQFEQGIDPELLAEIEEWEQQEDDTPKEYHFTTLDPYAKVDPSLYEQQRHNFRVDEDGHIHVKNISAYWIPELAITEKIHGTVYTVTGSYEGDETFLRKLERITSKKFAENLEDSE